MRVRRSAFLALAAPISALLVLACSSQSSHPPTLECTLACSTHGGSGGSNTADGGNPAKPADDAASDAVPDTATE